MVVLLTSARSVRVGYLPLIDSYSAQRPLQRRAEITIDPPSPHRGFDLVRWAPLLGITHSGLVSHVVLLRGSQSKPAIPPLHESHLERSTHPSNFTVPTKLLCQTHTPTQGGSGYLHLYRYTDPHGFQSALFKPGRSTGALKKKGMICRFLIGSSCSVTRSSVHLKPGAGDGSTTLIKG